MTMPHPKGAFDTALVPDKVFMRVSGVSKRADGYVDQLDFTCMMNELGTPQLAGSFPTSDTSANQRGCKIGTFGGTQLNAPDDVTSDLIVAQSNPSAARRKDPFASLVEKRLSVSWPSHETQ